MSKENLMTCTTFDPIAIVHVNERGHAWCYGFVVTRKTDLVGTIRQGWYGSPVQHPPKRCWSQQDRKDDRPGTRYRISPPIWSPSSVVSPGLATAMTPNTTPARANTTANAQAHRWPSREARVEDRLRGLHDPPRPRHQV